MGSRADTRLAILSLKKRRGLVFLASCWALVLCFGIKAMDAKEFFKASGSEMAAKRSREPMKGKVDINLASLDELNRLPGMTSGVAARLIQNRPYKKLDDLVTKRVMGKKQFAKLRDLIFVGPSR